MPIDPKTIFNQNFPLDVKSELETRKRYAAGIERDSGFINWNYKKYAYISVSTTGENELDVICSSEFTIGDGSINEQAAGLDLYELEKGIRRPLPILTNVDLSSDGSTDPVQATMWTAKVTFDVFTLDQLDKAEKSFLRAGSVVVLDFGWRNQSGNPNRGQITGTVTNFSFSAKQDGSFSCDFEMVGANSMFSAERLEGSPATKEDAEARSEDKQLEPYPNIVDAILTQHKLAFGLKDNEDYSDDQAGDGKITLKGNNNQFALANIQESSGFMTKLAKLFGIDTNDQFIPYITLSGFIDRINKITQKSKKGKTIVCDSETTIGGFVPEMFSSDPTVILFGGEMAQYGNQGDMSFGETLSDFKSDNGADLSKIRIGIPFLTEIYNELKSFKESDLDQTQTPPAVKDMLNKIFDKIEECSGGLYQLRIYQKAYDDTNNVYIINKRVGYNGAAGYDDVFEFKVLGEDSIIRDMSISTEFNSDLQAAAMTAGRSGGSSTELPKEVFDNLYSDCPETSEQTQESEIKEEDKVTIEQIQKLKENYGKGFDESMVSNSVDKLRNYLIQNKPAPIKKEFQSVPYLINLSVTLDGIFGIPYFGRFTVDRLPKTYKDGVYFKVMRINHSFDCQGGWTTQIDGIMQVKTDG